MAPRTAPVPSAGLALLAWRWPVGCGLGRNAAGRRLGAHRSGRRSHRQRPADLHRGCARARRRARLAAGRRGPRRQFRRLLFRARRADPVPPVLDGSRSARARPRAAMCAASWKTRANACWRPPIYEEIDARATDPDAIERLYRENASRLGQGTEIHLRHIQFETREAADAAKRRLDQGERFEALAFELSTDRDTGPDGGDLGFRAVSDLAPAIRDGDRERQCRRSDRAAADRRHLAPRPHRGPPRTRRAEPRNAAAAHHRVAALPGDQPVAGAPRSATRASSACASKRKAWSQAAKSPRPPTPRRRAGAPTPNAGSAQANAAALPVPDGPGAGATSAAAPAPAPRQRRDQRRRCTAQQQAPDAPTRSCSRRAAAHERPPRRA